MSILNTLTIAVNGFTLVMAMSFLVIILWYNRNALQNQFFAMLLFMMFLWSSGSFFTLLVTLIEPNAIFIDISIILMELGFAGSAITAYGFAAILVSVFSRRFRWIMMVSLGMLFSYYTIAFRSGILATERGTNYYQLPNISTLFYMLFTVGTLYLLWTFRARVIHKGLWTGMVLFVLGQSIGLLNPELKVLSLSIIVSSIAILMIALSIVHRDFILPVQDSKSQIQAMHNMSLAITSQLAIETVLDQIAQQAGERLNANGVSVFLHDEGMIRIAAVNGLPKEFVGISVPVGYGLAWDVVQNQHSVLLESYTRDLETSPDFPYYTETFGSVACVPLIYGQKTIGALMIIISKQGHTLYEEDLALLEMLGDQAAVAIAHGQLFNQQRALTYQVEQAKNQLETLLTSTENPVIAVDRKLNLIFANKAAERLFVGLKYTMQPVYEILPEVAFPKSYKQILIDIKTRRVHIYEIVFNDHIYSSHLAPLSESGTIVGWVAILHDVTELKELNRLKSEMVRMTSHDLKNPLQAALANLELLADSGTYDEEQQYSIQAIDKQLNRMFRIISGVLDLERIREGKKAIQRCQPAQIVQHAFYDWVDFAKQRQQKLILDIPDEPLPFFQGDAGQFERAISNLIENALKFTDKQGVITVRVIEDNDMILFSVQDSGVGIPEEYHQRIFDSFFRANQKGTEHITGTGLGLHLVKTIVQNHGGQIWVESEMGRGTTFFISIPSIVDDKVF